MRYRTTIGALALVAALALAGCGRADSEGASGSSESASTTSVSEGPATGEIEIWTAGGYGDKLGTFVADFEKENPDATVTITDIPWAELVTKIQAAVAGGTVPDAVMIGSSQMAQVISTGALQTVPDGLVDTNGFFEGATDPATAQGSLYGLPWYVETRVLYYRSDLAEAAGLTAPTTWEELTAFLTSLKTEAGGAYGISLPVGDNEDSTQVIIPFLAQAGGSLLNEKGDKWTIDTPEMASALDYYASFFTDGLAPISGYGDTQSSGFVDGNTPSFISGQWMIGTLQDATSKDWVEQNVATVPVPSGVANNDSYLGGGDLGVFSDADNTDGAWKLIQWLMQTDTQVAWHKLTGDLPSVTAAWQDESLTSDPRNVVMQKQLEHTVAAPAVPAYDELSGLIESQAEQVANGLKTGKEAAAELQQKADALGMGW